MAFAFFNPADIGLPAPAPGAGQTIGSLTLPAGRYVISAKAQFDLGDSGATSTTVCTLFVNNVELDTSAVTIPVVSTATMPFAGVTDVAAGPGVVTLDCVGAGVVASNRKLSAIQVDTLNVQ